jgi:hypothetical protein
MLPDIEGILDEIQRGFVTTLEISADEHISLQSASEALLQCNL